MAMTPPGWLSEAGIGRLEGRLNRIYELEAAVHYTVESGCDAWVELKKLYAEMSREAPALLAMAREALELRGQLDAAEQAIGRWQVIELERNQLRSRLAAAEQERYELRSLINECAARVMPGEKDSGESYVEMLREARQENARLREALNDVLGYGRFDCDTPLDEIRHVREVAREALRPDPQPREGGTK